MIYCRHAIVFTVTQPWCTVKAKENMTIGIIQEMCETVLLYLGNKLYRVLRCRPFTLDRPVTIDLDDTQQMRFIHHDHNLHEAYLEMHINSAYEHYVREEEIDQLEPPKPVVNITSPTVFDIDYVPIKQESSETYSAEESTSAVIGHLLHQPASVAKEIKQELINCAAHTIAGRHTESCQIAQFVSDKGSSSSVFHIEDIRSLLSADKAANVMAPTELPMVTELPVVTDDNDDISSPLAVMDYSVIGNPEGDDTPLINPALCVVTSGNVDTTTQDILHGDSILEITPVADSDPIPAPLHGVTPPHVPTTSHSLSASPTGNTTLCTKSQPGDSISTEPALPVVTSDGDGYMTISPDINSEANVDSSSNEPPMLSSIEPLHVVTEDQSLAPPVLTPISIIPHADIVDHSNTIGYSEQTEHSEDPPETATTSSDVPNTTSKSGLRMTSSPKHFGASVYYEVLTPEGVDVVHISHGDIMSRSCIVSVQNLSENDIKELQEINQSHKPESESTSNSLSSSEQKTTSNTDWVPSPKKRVTPSNRLHKQPSRAR